MARRVFFSFHYDHDIWRANQVRNANVVAGTDVAGFFDHSEYEQVKRQGREAIRRMILRHLDRTSVTVVLIGTYTAHRPWVQYEIEQSVKRNNGLVGIRINHLLAPTLPGLPLEASPPGLVPYAPPPGEMPVYLWYPRQVVGFAQVIEQAGRRGDALRRATVRTQAFKNVIASRPIPPPPLPAIPVRAPSTNPSSSLFEALSRRRPVPPPGADARSILEALLGRYSQKKPWEP